MGASAPERGLVDHLTDDALRVRKTVQSLGVAIHAAEIDQLSPSLARATAAAENLYDQIDAEFGLLTSTEAGRRMGSRSQATRNLPAAARRAGRLLGLPRGRYITYPTFQFDEQGARPVVAELIARSRTAGRSEVGLIQWLMSPTTHLDGRRPVDILDDPDLLLATARSAFSVQW